jgi:hypothetical protein
MGRTHVSELFRVLKRAKFMFTKAMIHFIKYNDNDDVDGNCNGSDNEIVAITVGSRFWLELLPVL